RHAESRFKTQTLEGRALDRLSRPHAYFLEAPGGMAGADSEGGLSSAKSVRRWLLGCAIHSLRSKLRSEVMLWFTRWISSDHRSGVFAQDVGRKHHGGGAQAIRGDL